MNLAANYPAFLIMRGLAYPCREFFLGRTWEGMKSNNPLITAPTVGNNAAESDPAALLPVPTPDQLYDHIGFRLP